MATQRQMIPTVREVTAKSGRVFEFARPTVGLRMALVDFGEVVEGCEERMAGGDVAAIRKICDALLDLLVNWLSRTYPGITREEIAEAFDVDDISAVIDAINNFEQEVAALNPPAARAGKARKK
ncbi:MAG: hypothetical protein ACYC2Y_10525 [Armatimonadota bacterium]